jgi:hypothetical protein
MHTFSRARTSQYWFLFFNALLHTCRKGILLCACDDWLRGSARKAQFPFLAHVAMALISAMLFPTFVREETQLFTVFAPPASHARFL